jgi:hypothetical protein
VSIQTNHKEEVKIRRRRAGNEFAENGKLGRDAAIVFLKPLRKGFA